MKRLLRSISTIVAICILATMFTVSFGVAAAENGSLLTPGQEGILRYLGILDEDLPNYGKPLTRGELAHMAARVSNVSEYTAGDYYFSDVNEDNPYYKEISALVVNGVLSGDGNGYFRPNDTVTDLEACKVFSVILGYAEIGQYESYLRTAKEAGLIDAVVMDGSVTYAEGLYMAHRALHAEMMEAIVYGDERNYKLQKGYLAIERYHNLVKQTGTVDGMYNTRLYQHDSSIPEGHLLINKRLFQYEDESLLGKYVIFYSKREEIQTSPVIDYIYADETRNNIVTLQGKDVSGIKDSKLVYWKEAKEKSYRLVKSPDVIINGVAYPDFTDADLQPAVGSVTLIDNNDDTYYDVIVVEDIEYVVFGSRDRDTNVIYGKYPEVSLGGKNQENDIVMMGPYGKINIGTLSEGTVLRVKSSKNTEGNKIIRITQLEEVVTGQVTALTDTQITVGGKNYTINDATVTDEEIRLGKTVSVYPDAGLAAVVLHAGNDTYQFGYLVGAAKTGGVFSGNFSVRIVDGTYTLREFEAGDSVYIDESKFTDADKAMKRLENAHKMRSYNETEMTVLYANEGTDVTTSLDQMEEGDQKFPYSQPIRFRLNDDGKLTHLDTMIYESEYELEDSLQPVKEGNSEVRKLSYAAYPYSFYNQAGSELVFTAKNIDRILRVQRIERDKTNSSRPALGDGNGYVVEAFNVDPITKIAKYAVVYDKMSTAANQNSSPFIISDIYDALNENGEIQRKIDLLHPSESKTVILSAELQLDLGIGDIVQVETDVDGVAQNITMLFDQSLGKDQERFVATGNVQTNYTKLYAYYCLSYGTLVDFDGTIYTHTTSVKEDLDGVEAYNELHNFRHNGTIVYVYDDSTGTPTIKQGSTKDIVTYRMDPDTNQKAVVCIKRQGHIQYVLLIKEEA